MSDSAQARLSAAERERALDELTRHFVIGRLDAAQFDERCHRAIEATTKQQLAWLFTDLPAYAAPPPPAPANPIAPRLAVIIGAILSFTVVLALTSGNWAWWLLLVGAAVVVPVYVRIAR
ncbi:DUF1707 domain-containing protein [Nocardia sp. NPDC006630]|uniref:DUF1707 SHOCT-like domain-containing protein n=1 Tax=Nocardia sp. NPDC006630 TaxID=3157181 RepID=UPI0033BB3E49